MLAQFISVVLALRSLTKTYPGHNLMRIAFDMKDIARMLTIGFPLALQSILFPVANSIIHASINKMGTDVIAAWAVCGKPQNIGAGKPDRVVRGSLTGAAFSMGAVGLISLCLFLFPGPLGGLFVTAADKAVLSPMIIHFMRMMAPFYIFYAAAEAFSGACCGTGDTVRPMILTLLCTCGLRVVSIWFILPLFGTMDCIIWIYIASWIAAGAAFTAMFSVKIRKLLRDNPGETAGTAET